LTTQTVRKKRKRASWHRHQKKEEENNQQAHINMDLQTTETDSQTRWMLSSLLQYEIKRKDNHVQRIK